MFENLLHTKKTEDAQMLSIEPFKNAFVKVNVYNNSSFIQ